MKKKRIAVLLAGAFFIVSFAACGQAGQAQGASGETARDSRTEAAPSELEPAELGAAGTGREPGSGSGQDLILFLHR